jgi:hypothetical protein
MKEIFISVFIVLIIFVSGFFSEKYLKSSGNKIVDKLNKIELQISSGNFNEKSKVEEISNEWKKLKDSWNVLINHRNVDDIEIEIEKFTKYYENGKKEESLVSIGTIRMLIEDIPKAESFSFVNIF